MGLLQVKAVSPVEGFILPGGKSLYKYLKINGWLININIFAPVIPAGALQTESGLHTLAVSGGAGGGAIVQYATNQDAQFYVPGPMLEDQTRKRELRLLKNREAARECRRKKKEYIKCLENRVAVLENQNKALIEELKSLKELYCQQKTE
ncbi:cyclic AMP response element-binding protein B-like [Manduca sexta]|uniref:cyclic AMP response element-binding protein B-like n=1 Tax=Manduca sexta TaxID=7130 RepID=UPI00188E495C|nr:cyclic AMP response element-binding protein B-like [Manduca sexta]